jgi:RNA polymerase sigma-70 factor (ECF subfamily)
VRKSGDDFARLFQASFRKLWCIAAGIVGNAATAEDVVQEAALVALDKFEQFRQQDPPAADVQDGAAGDELLEFAAWMSQIVRYVALNQYRKDRRHRAASLSEGHGNGLARPAPASPPLQLTALGQLPDDQETFDDRVMRALQQVGEVARACLLLRTIELLDYKQIARLLEIPEGTAMSHVHRARRLLRRELAPAGERTFEVRT